MLGSDAPTERKEHGRDSLEVNTWCALTHQRSIGLYFFDEDITNSNSIPHTLENYAVPRLNSNNNIGIRLDWARIHFAETVHDCLNVNCHVY
jgi:hypothetical protein